MASQLLNFPLAPFFAIFCRSWLLVCIVGDLLRFCFILARDVWEEDAPPGGMGPMEDGRFRVRKSTKVLNLEQKRTSKRLFWSILRSRKALKAEF